MTKLSNRTRKPVAVSTPKEMSWQFSMTTSWNCFVAYCHHMSFLLASVVWFTTFETYFCFFWIWFNRNQVTNGWVKGGVCSPWQSLPILLLHEPLAEFRTCENITASILRNRLKATLRSKHLRIHLWKTTWFIARWHEQQVTGCHHLMPCAIGYWHTINFIILIYLNDHLSMKHVEVLTSMTSESWANDSTFGSKPEGVESWKIRWHKSLTNNSVLMLVSQAGAQPCSQKMKNQNEEKTCCMITQNSSETIKKAF